MLKYLRIFSILILFSSICSFRAFAEEMLNWQGCIQEAAKNHPDLIAAEEEIKQSEASKKITASALYPQVDASVNASTASSASGAGKSTQADTYNYGVSANQLFFDGAKTINEVKSASETIKAYKQNFRFTSATVRYRLRTAFVDLLRAQEMLNITQEIYNIRRENMELITLRYESGLEHKGALMTSEADLASAIYDISQAKRDVEVAQRSLIKEMGRDKLTPITVKGDFEINDSAEIKPDFEAIVKNNPSVQQLIAQKNAAEFNLRSAYANFYPSLTGSAGANKNGSHWAPRGNQWNLGLALSLPIFEGGLRFAQVSQAKAYLSQLKENERSSRDSAVLTLEQTWAILQDAVENVGVQNKSLKATEERSKIAQAQYSTGFITFDNWIIIEDNLVKAKKAFLEAQANKLYAEASWIQAKGETLEYE
ncbi:MAG: TolC family protein [Candidatus Omnitrophica bacterium]|jgi:outer membrane protein TolC|nr:TolC family protein [Candidatus Omnitrophota bacterium]